MSRRIHGRSTDVDTKLGSSDKLIVVTEPATIVLADHPHTDQIVQIVTDAMGFPGARVSVHGGRFPIEGGHINLHENSIVTLKFTHNEEWVSKGPRARTADRGEEGPRGHEGPEGERGRRGHEGERGHRGHTGPTGPTGATGSQGSAGATGSTGSTGPAGGNLLNGFARLEVPDTFISGDPPSTVTFITIAPNSLTTGILEIIATASVHSTTSSLAVFTINLDGADLVGFTVQPIASGENNGFDSGSVIFKIAIANTTISHTINLNIFVPNGEGNIIIGPVGAPSFGDNASLFFQELAT